MSTSRPILFSAELVRAILNGQKSVTRRVVLPTTAPRLAPEHMEPWIPVLEQETDEEGRLVWRGTHPEYPAEGKWFTCPYGAPGDELWVQEGYRVDEFEGVGRRIRLGGIYLADGAPFSVLLDAREAGLFSARKRHLGSSPGRFMYRSLARIRLEVTSVGVERVRELTEAEAQAEGLPGISEQVAADGEMLEGKDYFSARVQFVGLWRRINGPRGYGWDEDPYVWRVAFQRARPAGAPTD